MSVRAAPKPLRPSWEEYEHRATTGRFFFEQDTSAGASRAMIGCPRKLRGSRGHSHAVYLSGVDDDIEATPVRRNPGGNRNPYVIAVDL